ncbi:Hsp70 family protein [Desulfosarcina ovata]|nr:Hsp70 family protein [Desulfosarcina ovata]
MPSMPSSPVEDARDDGPTTSVIGIDLGTTNSAIAYVNPDAATDAHTRIGIFDVPQLTGLGEFSRLPVLPSFLYLPGPYDIDPASIRHPWPTAEDRFAGALARDHGAQVPARLVSSAKSWLCHGKVDRHGRILPWGAPQEVAKVSPVEASAAYLTHLRNAWNHAWGDEEEHFLENQQVILTVPASFDEVARELTLEAAGMAGLKDVILLEEPLAAFYSWLMRHEDDWQTVVQPGELILICDVGGGTTDLTLITLNAVDGGSPRFERIAVGDHLILGGDNVDLALARKVEAHWHGSAGGLDTDRWKALCHQCRQAKERILSGQAEGHRVTLTGTGSRLIGGTLAADLDREAVEAIVLEGFFPLTDPAEAPPKAQRAAITEFGLPYESEPAITRHLHRFLMQHATDVAEAVGKPVPLPDRVLFNGGALKPEIIQNRIVDNLVHAFGGNGAKRPHILENPNHDTAVALGATYYGLVKIGRGVRVGSGSPRAYYLGVGRTEQTAAPSSKEAICLIERGLEEGSPIDLGKRPFMVLANQPVQFELFSSSYRSGDATGDVIGVDDSLTALPPLQTVIQYGKKGLKTKLPVRIEGHYTELGTLSLWCRSETSQHRWQLQFQLRDTAGVANVREQTVLDQALVQEAREAIIHAFQNSAQEPLNGLVKRICGIADLPRDDWPLSFIRELSDTILSQTAARSRSAVHEARWMNLLGFCLRPGFGDAMDEQRVKQVWRLFNPGAVHPKQVQVKSEWWIMWRRIAGGLNPGQQRQLSQALGTLLQPGKNGKIKLPLQQQLELWMAVGNLERLYVKDKVKWGGILLSQMQTGAARHQLVWALSRLSARELLYGPVDRVIPAQTVSMWIDALLGKNWDASKMLVGALVRMARKTGDRTRDLGPDVIRRIIDWLPDGSDGNDARRFLEDVIPMEQQEEQAVFGESLPAGLLFHESQ